MKYLPLNFLKPMRYQKNRFYYFSRFPLEKTDKRENKNFLYTVKTDTYRDFLFILPKILLFSSIPGTFLDAKRR